jgi:hypothetical protein
MAPAQPGHSGPMRAMRPTTDAVTPVPVDRPEQDAQVLAFRTRDGETVVFEGSSEDEVRARANDFLAWAS